MAKEIITLSFGHPTEVTLAGDSDKRTQKRDWHREHGVCKDCYKRERNRRVETLEHHLSLPALTGSDSQVFYARDIRTAKIEDFLTDYGGEVILDAIAAAIAERTRGSLVFFEVAARFWLDAKGKKMNSLINAAKKSKRRPKIALEKTKDPIHFGDHRNNTSKIARVKLSYASE